MCQNVGNGHVAFGPLATTIKLCLGWRAYGLAWPGLDGWWAGKHHYKMAADVGNWKAVIIDDKSGLKTAINAIGPRGVFYAR